MDRAQGDISSLLLVRETGSDGVGTSELWLDVVFSGIPVLEGHVPLPQLGYSDEGLGWSTWVGELSGGRTESPELVGEAEPALEMGVGRTERLCGWPECCGKRVLLDLSIRSERAGEGWKHFSGEERTVPSVTGSAEDNKVEGCVQRSLFFSGPLRSPSVPPLEEEREDKPGATEGTSARLTVSVCNWGRVALLLREPPGIFSTSAEAQLLLAGAGGARGCT